jgi:hypothetical protein
MVSEDRDGLVAFAAQFAGVLRRLDALLATNPRADVLLRGGDSLLLHMPAADIAGVIALIKEALGDSSFTFSGGYGRSMREAFIALKLAKASGKDRFVDFEAIDHQ